MHTLIVILHIVVSVALILVILLQTGKGSDIGAVFGGGSSQTLFGSTGPTSFLSKLTAGAAIVFMLTSLFLAYFSGRSPSSSIMKSGAPAPVQTMPGPPASLPAPPAGVPAMPAAPPAR
jgi:preprotein translocase subunit SecG